MKEQIKKKKRKYPNQSIYLQYIYIYNKGEETVF